jgi:hypothetical protein
MDPSPSIRPKRSTLLSFFHSDSRRHVTLAFRTQVLIEQACSLSTDSEIPWDEWGRGSVALEAPNPGRLHTLVQGLHVITVKKCAAPGSHREQLCLRSFDFSLRACGTLSDIGEGGEAVRAARHEDGRDLFLEGSENLDDWELYSLGDSVFFYPVSCLCSWKVSVG